MTTKYRIIETNHRFFIQWKFMFWWFYLRSIGEIPVSFESKLHAQAFLQNYRMKPKIHCVP